MFWANTVSGWKPANTITSIKIAALRMTASIAFPTMDDRGCRSGIKRMKIIVS
ncbi:MAG: hypothetical protein R3D34_14195 [Nitratireductor sp.]